MWSKKDELNFLIVKDVKNQSYQVKELNLVKKANLEKIN